MTLTVGGLTTASVVYCIVYNLNISDTSNKVVLTFIISPVRTEEPRFIGEPGAVGPVSIRYSQ